MVIFQVDAWFSAMAKEDAEQELKVVAEVFAALEGELIGAEVGLQGRLLAYVRAESELMVSDVFEASHFTVEQIVYLGWSHETSIDLSRPASHGTWKYRPEQPANPLPCTVRAFRSAETMS